METTEVCDDVLTSPDDVVNSTALTFPGSRKVAGVEFTTVAWECARTPLTWQSLRNQGALGSKETGSANQRRHSDPRRRGEACRLLLRS